MFRLLQLLRTFESGKSNYYIRPSYSSTCANSNAIRFGTDKPDHDMDEIHRSARKVLD